VRLSGDTQEQLPADVVRPGYDVVATRTGIVHLGIGAFHRAHQAVYTDDAMAMAGGDWRIIGVSLRSDTVRDQLAPQDGLYTVTQRSADAPQTRLIGAIARVIVAPEEPEAVITALADPQTRIVTLTVTEKGYYQTAEGGLDIDHQTIAGELAGGKPVTIYGFLARALQRRRAADAGGVTLLSCDNLSENGQRLRALLLDFLERSDPGLAQWTADHCSFPSSMVDRIVPATTDADLKSLAEGIGMDDRGAVFTEPFTQWVIEDHFAAGRPAWEQVGAQMVADVRPYETAKLRMLNGAHSALAYIGLLNGHDYVHQAVNDPAIRPLIERLLLEEAAPTIDAAEGQDLEAYAADLLARFDNPALNHRLIQIAMDGSQKIPQRWLETLHHHQRDGRACPAILQALAAWILHVRGDRHPVDDPMADQLAALWRRHGAGGMAAALFGEEGLFASRYRADADTLGALRDHLTSQAAL
jgi:fructuronate reductase